YPSSLDGAGAAQRCHAFPTRRSSDLDDDHVGGQSVGVGVEELGQMTGADLFLTLDHDLDADRGTTTEGADCAQMHDDAGLVVTRPAPVEAAASLEGFERPGVPLFLRAGWLDVVVGVEQNGRCSFGSRDLTEDRGVGALELEKGDV